MSTSASVIACNRFGLGAAPGELAEASGDPKGWLLQQLRDYEPRPAELAELPDTAGALSLVPFYRRRMERSGMLPPPPEDDERNMAARRAVRQLLDEERLGRLRQGVATRQSFCERLVRFWSNRLTVSISKGQVRPLAGHYERSVVRPHLMGRFEELLLASARSPAMLIYLNNQNSIGPGSRRGRNRERGLNENYAREVMELHSLGVDGGYDQADVLELAKGLTGWTLAGPQDVAQAAPDGFAFNAASHEPGSRRLLGRDYDQEGEAQGRAMLTDLARHPSTARHLARSLLQHFVADDPPAAAVERLAARFLDSGGDLPTLYAALVESPEGWEEGRQKFKQPEEYLISLLRSLPERPAIPKRLLGSLEDMGQPTWAAPSPAGWPERAEEWVSAGGLWARLELAEREAARLGKRFDLDPRALLEACLGPAAGEATRFQVAGADSREQGLTLLYMSPDFQWR